MDAIETALPPGDLALTDYILDLQTVILNQAGFTSRSAFRAILANNYNLLCQYPYPLSSRLTAMNDPRRKSRFPNV